MDGLAALRLSDTLLGMVSLISILPSTPSRNVSQVADPVPAQKAAANLVLNLQHNTGSWATDYSYSLDDGLVGCRALYHFGLDAKTKLETAGRPAHPDADQGSGLHGRFSLGGEMFFSAKTKSAGCELRLLRSPVWKADIL